MLKKNMDDYGSPQRPICVDLHETSCKNIFKKTNKKLNIKVAMFISTVIDIIFFKNYIISD